jgi:hypothetical protein
VALAGENEAFKGTEVVGIQGFQFRYPLRRTCRPLIVYIIGCGKLVLNHSYFESHDAVFLQFERNVLRDQPKMLQEIASTNATNRPDMFPCGFDRRSILVKRVPGDSRIHAYQEHIASKV